jgi:DNA-binding LacI/PurR family transcriptional regulator
MSSSKATIYHVAKEAGVSIATVSRVLNFPLRVKNETRTAVMNAIDSLGYVPKAESRARAFMETRRIGVLIPFFTTPSFVQRLRGISEVLNKHEYELVIYPVDSKTRETSYLEILPLKATLDGLIIASQVFDEKIAMRLINNHLETVVIEYKNPNLCSIEIDDVAGGYMAAEYLVNKGYERIAFIGGQIKPEFGVDPIVKRMEGYKKVLKEKKIVLPDDFACEYAHNPGQILKKLVSYGLPLAIFAATDLQAIALIREARLMGLRIPQDVAIIGFDDIDMAEYFGLTTIHQPLDESGSIAANLLLSRLADPSLPVQHIQLTLKVIERETA